MKTALVTSEDIGLGSISTKEADEIAQWVITLANLILMYASGG